MADVIFAGTPSRPALGMAEVKLVIDNGDGQDPRAHDRDRGQPRRSSAAASPSTASTGRSCGCSTCRSCCRRPASAARCTPWWARDSWKRCSSPSPRTAGSYIEEAAGIAKHRRRKERAERKLSGLDQDLLRLQDVLGELRRQLKPLQQQAEMAKKHETLTTKAEELSRKLAAARLRALLREQDRRRSGWDEGLERRQQARELLDTLDTDVLAAADTRATASVALADAEQTFRQTQLDGSRAQEAYRAAVAQEGEAREQLAAQSSRSARLDALDDELRRVERGPGARHARTWRCANASWRRPRVPSASPRRSADASRRPAARWARRPPAAARRSRRCERSVTASERERDRLREALATVRERIAEVEARARTVWPRRSRRFDDRSAPMSEKRAQLELERRGLVDKIEELEDIRRRHESRRDLLEARRRDLEETAGSRFLSAPQGPRDRPAEGPGHAWRRAWNARWWRRSARSPTPSSTTTPSEPWPTPPRATAPSWRSRRAARCRWDCPASAGS